jgi:hypothetical protein
LENGEDELSPACELADGEIVSITSDQGSAYWKQKMESGEFKSGQTEVSGCEFVQSPLDGVKTCFIQTEGDRFLSNVVNTDNQEENERRILAVVEGNKKILVVRVIAVGGTTTANEDELALNVFDDSVNVAKQYKACSHGKLNVIKATDRDNTNNNADNGETSVMNGVTTVKVSSPTGPSNDRNRHAVMREAITVRLKDNFGTDARNLADHVMYCLPAGTMDGIAYAYINHWLSIYSDEWCNYVSAQMHEIGHNLNLAHSNENGYYKDQTGMVSNGGSI